MNKTRLNLFEIISITWISVAIFGLLFAILGIFYNTLILLSLVAILGMFIILSRRKSFEFTKPVTISVILSLIALGTAIALSLYTTPTLFEGRDEGSYTNAAIQLTRDHGLLHSSPMVKEFFNVYGPGKALNFPGFYYSPDGSLHSQFLPGYITWIATIYSLFGIKGLAFVNLLPLFTFLFSFYFILKKILRKNKFLSSSDPLAPQEKRSMRIFSIIGTTLLFTCFPLLFFYKFTLSEIYFGALVWFAFYLVLRYFEEKTFANYMLIFIPFVLMSFTRIETLGFVFILLMVLVLKDFNHMRQAKFQFIYALLGMVVAISLVYNANFFMDTAKNIVEPFYNKKTVTEPTTVVNVPDDIKQFYLPKVLHTYNIVPLLIMGSVYLIFLLKNRKQRLLIPLIFFLPTLIYLVDANISLDHPWMLRRFLFAIIPLFILYSTLFLSDLAERKLVFNFKYIAYGLATLLVLLNITLFFPQGPESLNLITYTQNKTLLAQTEQLAQRFTSRDLVLVSQTSSGNGWSLIAAPMRNLYGLNAIYFFNPNDLSRINKDAYENIYLIVSDQETLFKDLPKEVVSDYAIRNSIIEPQKDPLAKIRIADYETQGTIYRLEK